MKRLFLICNFITSLASLDAAPAEPFKTLKDGISLEVTHAEQDSKNLIKAGLTNGSPFPMCSGGLLWKFVFYSQLTDSEGNELLPFEKWANEFGQKSSNRYKHPVSMNAFQIAPGESVNFEFFLEDAYPAEAIAKGSRLEISWETRYFGTDVDFDGNPYRFPPDWKTSVTIPLADIGLGVAVDKEAIKPQPYETVNRSRDSASEQIAPASARTDGGPGRWPVIAALLFLLLAICTWLVARRRAKTKGWDVDSM